jgi:hypothetical protein
MHVSFIYLALYFFKYIFKIKIYLKKLLQLYLKNHSIMSLYLNNIRLFYGNICNWFVNNYILIYSIKKMAHEYFNENKIYVLLL